MLSHLRRRLVFILSATMFVIVAGALAGVAVLRIFGENLPDYESLREYQPKTVTRIYAGDGRLLEEFAHEKRIFVPIEAIPDLVKEAFLSAEDKGFYDHIGVAPLAIVRAAIENIRRIGSNQRLIGASTITQQVAKNFLLTNERSFDRKIKEAILAMRMEQAFSKDEILELYLNEIYLGSGAYGVAAAALEYFNRPLDELTPDQAAYLAILPKAPSRYDPERFYDAAINRRNWVLGRMVEDKHLTTELAEEARQRPIERVRRERTETVNAPYFAEEVRRTLIRDFQREELTAMAELQEVAVEELSLDDRKTSARNAEKRFYEGGLAVRTTISPDLQAYADEALRHGLVAYDRRHGWRGALAQIDLDGNWQELLDAVDPGFDLGPWQLAVVFESATNSAKLGLQDGTTATLELDQVRWARRAEGKRIVGGAVSRVSQVVSPGDVVAVERLVQEDGDVLALRQAPLVEGGLAVMDPHTGRVLAMSGGFSFKRSSFNRAVQALRQPGSSFKPFVYLAGLERGMTPSTTVFDGPMVLEQAGDLPPWEPSNYTENFYGDSTLRLGLEKSRNLMTIRLVLELGGSLGTDSDRYQSGMRHVVDTAQRFGIDRGLSPEIFSSALGATEATVLRMATAYSMLVNGGRKVEPVFVDRLQNSLGETVYRRDGRPCDGCLTASWDGTLPPDLPETRELVVDPRHAYQVVSMLEGVVERGTGIRAKDIGVPLAGKTGTTNDYKDAWFVGFSPDLVVATYVGHDQPSRLGDKEGGSKVALPVFVKFMEQVFKDKPAVPFRVPRGVRLVRVDARTGLLPASSTETVIEEAFLPGTEPRTYSPSYVATTEPDAEGGTSSTPQVFIAPAGSDDVSSGGLY